MKRLIFAIAVALTLSSCATSYYTPAPVTGAINISIQPSWGPAGYDYALYYYFPEFNFYYDVERALFYYQNYGRWVSAKVLPKGRHYPTDLHRYYKVVINERNPWNYNRQHKKIYKHHKGVYTQRNLRDERQGKEAPRRIQQPQQPTPPRNNNTVHPPQSTPNRGQGGNVGQGPSGSKPQGNTSKPSGNVSKPQGNTSKPSGNTTKPSGNVSKPQGNTSKPSTAPSRNNSSQGNVKPSGSGNSSQGNVRPGGSNVKPSGRSSTPSRSTTKPSSSSSSKSGGSKNNVSKGSSSNSGSSKSSSSGSRSGGSQSSGSRSTGSRGR